jgi:hypothetical protein
MEAPRNHRVEGLQLGPLVVDARFVAGDVHVGTQGVDDMNLMAALSSGLDQAPGRVEVGVARQYRNFHGVLFNL